MKISNIAIMYVLLMSVACADSVADDPRSSANLYFIEITTAKDVKFSMQCNGLTVPEVSHRTYFKNLLKQVSEGDLVVISSIPAKLPAWTIDQLKDTVELCGEKHVAMRFINDRPQSRNIMWWVSPYELPGHHEATEYYWNSEALGSGDDGFERALGIIRTLHRGNAVYYSIAEYRPLGYSVAEVPFRKREGELKAALQHNGVEFIRLRTFLNIPRIDTSTGNAGQK